MSNIFITDLIKSLLRLCKPTKSINQEEFEIAVKTILSIMEYIDDYTYAHSLRVTAYCELMADKLDFSCGDKRIITMAALLHDVGKIAVGQTILRKTELLTEAEWDLIKSHPRFGEEIMLLSPCFTEILPIIRHHHERWDGRGYPDGLAGEGIPFGARMLAVADSYDAITTNRPYRKARPARDALEEIRKCAKTQFDPIFVEVFASIL